MNKLVDFMNRLTDMDGGWWPLLKLRPAKDEYIDNLVVLKTTPFFGTVIGLSFIIISSEYNNLIQILIKLALGWLMFFIAQRLTFALAWNIRADKLKAATTKDD